MHRGYSTSSDTGNASDRGGRCGGGDRADIAMYGMGTVASGNVYQDMPHAVGNTPLIKVRETVRNARNAYLHIFMHALTPTSVLLCVDRRDEKDVQEGEGQWSLVAVVVMMRCSIAI